MANPDCIMKTRVPYIALHEWLTVSFTTFQGSLDTVIGSKNRDRSFSNFRLYLGTFREKCRNENGSCDVTTEITYSVACRSDMTLRVWQLIFSNVNFESDVSWAEESPWRWMSGSSGTTKYSLTPLIKAITPQDDTWGTTSSKWDQSSNWTTKQEFDVNVGARHKRQVW
jgi:hypothetical protein